MSRFLYLPFLIAVSIQVHSQNQIQYYRQHQLRGIVIDSVSFTPVPQVSIWTAHSSTISDADGNFSLVVWQNDSVHFSHVSYDDFMMSCNQQQQASRITVSLTQQVRLLEEVKIYPYLSESAFQQKILETIPVLSREEEIAAMNSGIISYLARSTPPHPMDANDNYIDYMKGPQGVVIFSSKPSNGLISAIKNVLNPGLVPYKRFLNSDSPTPLKIINPDSRF